MIKTQKGYLYGGTKSDKSKPERLIAKIQKQNSKSSRFKIPRTFEYRSFCIDGVRVETVENKMQTPTKAILFLHGGAFLKASDDFYRSHMLYFAKKLGVKVFFPDYSLMPNNPYPKQIEEIKIVWEYITQIFSPTDIALVGVDAGANLVLSLTQFLSVRKMILPSAQVLISPWLDMSASGDSYYDKFYLDKVFGDYVVEGPDLPTEIKKTRPYLYTNSVPNNDPSVSPLFGPLWGLPSTYICVGDYSILQSDAEILYEKLKNVGVNCEYECADGKIGEYVLFYTTDRKAKKSMNNIILWLENALK